MHTMEAGPVILTDSRSFRGWRTARTQQCGEDLLLGMEREGIELIYEIRGNGFLHHMVRNLVGHSY